MTRSIRETVYNNRWMRRLLGSTLLVSAFVAFAPSIARAADESLDLGGTPLELRLVPKGAYTRGSSAADPPHEKDEEPAHPVTLTKDFWIGKYPVTRRQFQKFVADTRYVTEAEKGQSGGAAWDGKALAQKKEASWKSPGFPQTDDHPVVMVTYGDAIAFVAWASRKTAKRVRLPTEAEWEYAARGGSTTPWPSASTEPDALANGWFKASPGNGTRPVGQKKPNALGVFDISGQVFEWCSDVYAPYREEAVVDPEATANGGGDPDKRVLRGGSWFRTPKRGRSAARHRAAPGTRSAEYGFRVVVTSEEPLAPGVTGAGPDFAQGGPLGLAPSSAPAGPLADGEPVRLDGVGTGSEAFSWGLLIGSPVAAAAAAVAWMLLRGKRSARLARPRPARPAPAAMPATPAKPAAPARTAPLAEPAPVNVAPAKPAKPATPTPAAAAVASASTSAIITRPVADGFFVIAPHLTRGTRVRYEHTVDGHPVIGVVAVEGDETFVLTGSPPRSAIKILELLPPEPPRAKAESAPLIELEPEEEIEARSAPPPVPSRPKAPPLPRAADSTSPVATLKMLPASDSASSTQMPAAPAAPPSSPKPPEATPAPPPPPPSSSARVGPPTPPSPAVAPPAPESAPVGPPSPFSSPALPPSPPSSPSPPAVPPAPVSSAPVVPPSPPSSPDTAGGTLEMPIATVSPASTMEIPIVAGTVEIAIAPVSSASTVEVPIVEEKKDDVEEKKKDDVEEKKDDVEEKKKDDIEEKKDESVSPKSDDD